MQRMTPERDSEASATELTTTQNSQHSTESGTESDGSTSPSEMRIKPKSRQHLKRECKALGGLQKRGRSPSYREFLQLMRGTQLSSYGRLLKKPK